MSKRAMASLRTAWLVAACAAAGIGCSEQPSQQVLTGRVTTSGALGVRAVAGNEVITAAAVRSDGSFTLSLPAGQRYRLEVLTTSGVRHVYGNDATDLSFQICQPSDPFDVGGIGPNGGTMPPDDLGGGGTGGGSEPGCADPTDPNDPMCVPPPPCDPNDPSCGSVPPCDPTQDPNCGSVPPPCMPGDPNCGTEPPKCDPNDPTCVVCSDPMDPTCWPPPPPCGDVNDPYCMCAGDGTCPPPTCAPGEPNCWPEPPPPCADPTDPSACEDPCMVDPLACACPANDDTCWPMPLPPECDPNGTCEPGGMVPENPPTDFGCENLPGGTIAL